MTTLKEKTQVLIAVPMRRFDPEHAARDLPEHLQHLLALLSNSPDLPWKFEMMTFGGGNVSRGRNKIVASFLRGAWKWLVFLDDDIIDGTPEMMAQALFRILSHRKHVCGGLYTTKDPDRPHWVLNTYREPEIGKDGLLLVPELGTGGMKTYHRDVFERLIQVEPDLAYICDESAAPEWGFFCQGLMTVDGRRRWLPEDYWLDQLCRKHGIDVYVDTGVRFRHLDTATKRTFPLDDEWPTLPGPRKPIRPPSCAEEMAAVTIYDEREIMPLKSLVICLQYWAGDRDAAMRLARFIADLEPRYRDDVELRFVVRHDAEAPDDQTAAMVAQKMRVSIRMVPVHVVGYPQSPNYMAGDTIHDAANWADTAAVLLMESDCVPVSSGWIHALMADWGRATKAGKLVMGSWRPECTDLGHINGNMVFHPQLTQLIDLPSCPPKKAWDVFWARHFAPVWCRTGLIANRYFEMYLDAEKLMTPECGTRPPVLVHGVKDQSVWKYAKQITGQNA